MRLNDLFDWERERSDSGDSSQANPLAEQDALYESQILDVRYDAIRSVIGIIFEMRLADRIRDCSAALIVASEVSEFSWRQVDRNGLRTAWTVLASRPRRNGDSVGMELLTSPDARLIFAARRASYYSLTMPGIDIDSAPPDYSSGSITEVRNDLAHWQSTVKVVREAHVQPSAARTRDI